MAFDWHVTLLIRHAVMSVGRARVESVDNVETVRLTHIGFPRSEIAKRAAAGPNPPFSRLTTNTNRSI